MSRFVFPDNTVFCNFAAVRRLDVLEAVLAGRGRWTEAVAYEVSRSAAYLPDLGTIAAAGWLGDPVEIDSDADTTQVERIRRAFFGGIAANRTQHLGEAQTCHVLSNWTEFAGSSWVSDDRDSLEFARLKGISTLETFDLVSTFVANGDSTTREAHDLLQAMLAVGRHLRVSKDWRDFN